MESLRQAAWDNDDWRQRAACREEDLTLFFPVGVTGPAEAQIAMAKRVCCGCLVKDQCLEFAVRTHQEHGVWGGASEEERRDIRRARRAAARLLQAS